MLRRWFLYAAVAVLATVGGVAGASAGPLSHGAASADRYQTKVFVRGAPIHGANGLAVDASGRLLVASGMGCELVVLDRQTGEVLARLGHDVGVDSPDDVAVGPDGSVYWTDLSLGQVGRLAPDGDVTKQFVAPGMNPIAFTADGRLFVAQAFFGDGLYELDPNLANPPREVIPNSGVPPFVEQLNGFDFGPDGMLYSPQPFQGKIVRIDPESGAKELVADALPAPPTSVEFDSQGHLYASLAEGTIVRVDLDSGGDEVVAHIRDSALDNMVFDARDRLFVSDSNDGSVYEVAPGGGIRTLSRGGLILPGGLALMEDQSGRESLFVSDVWRLVRFDANSGRQLDVDRSSPAGGGIVQPWSVAPDGVNVIVTSWLSAPPAVQIWDPRSNAVVHAFTDFAVPVNAIRFDGDLVVAELATGNVTRQDENGTRSVIATHLAVPSGLAATDHDLWVAEWATGNVWQIVAGGEVVTPPRLTATGLALPEGMAVDHDGSLLVVEAGKGRLSRIDPATGQVTTVADGLELGLQGSAAAPPAWALSSVAVGRDGTIFVSGDRANVVYRLRPLPTS